VSACEQCGGALVHGECSAHGRPETPRSATSVCPDCGGTGQCSGCPSGTACHSCGGSTWPAGTGAVSTSRLDGAEAQRMIDARALPGQRTTAVLEQAVYSPPQRCLDGAEARALLAARGFLPELDPAAVGQALRWRFGRPGHRAAN
jgi:hypothetical protein